MRLVVDLTLCQGYAQCCFLAPEVFRHDDNRQSTVVDPAGAPAETVVEAAGYCPTGAIEVVDAETGEVLFPS